VERLILEVQYQRLTLLSMRELIDEYVRQARATATDRRLVDGDALLMRWRVAEIDDTPRDRSDEKGRSYARSPQALPCESEGRLRLAMRNR
jgi:hypothetical protein